MTHHKLFACSFRGLLMLAKPCYILCLTTFLFLTLASTYAAPPSPPAGFTASIVSSNPLVWDKYDREFALFKIRVTNTGSSADAYEIKSVQSTTTLSTFFGWVYSPTPTLPLNPGASDSFYVKIGGPGFCQPPPKGPASGDYSFLITIQSTVDTSISAILTATIRRSNPSNASTGTVTGRVIDAQTGGAVTGQVNLGDPSSVQDINLSGSTTSGNYSIMAPAGTYWLWVDASGYQSKFVYPLTITAGQSVTQNLSLNSISVKANNVTPSATGDAVLPTYRAAFNSDLSRIATIPGLLRTKVYRPVKPLLVRCLGKSALGTTDALAVWCDT